MAQSNMDIQSFQTASAEFVKKYKRLLLWKEYAQALETFVWDDIIESKMSNSDYCEEFYEKRDELGNFWECKGIEEEFLLGNGPYSRSLLEIRRDLLRQFGES